MKKKKPYIIGLSFSVVRQCSRKRREMSINQIPKKTKGKHTCYRNTNTYVLKGRVQGPKTRMEESSSI
jgi:hypothetical protein